MTAPNDTVPQEDSYEAYALSPGRYTARRGRGPRYLLTLGLWAFILAVGMMILSFIDSRVPDIPNRYVCPPDCGRPPTGLPVAVNPRFTADDGSFSVSYPAPSAAYDVTIEPDGVTAEWTGGDGGMLRLFGVPAAGRDARQVATDLLADGFPDARVVYELPNATVGYQNGFGEVADFQPLAASHQSGALRVITIVAVKNDLALVAAGVGPFRQFGPTFGPGPRRRPTCRSPRTWASTSTASAGAATRRAESYCGVGSSGWGPVGGRSVGGSSSCGSGIGWRFSQSLSRTS